LTATKKVGGQITAEQADPPYLTQSIN